MERDLNVMPGFKIAGCVVLVVAVVVFGAPYVAYVFAWGFNSTFSNLRELGPVDFHGKVVGPQGNGIPGVKLTAKIKAYRVIGGYFERTEVYETDSTGLFRIQARKAHSVILYNFSKSGFSIRRRPEQRGQQVELLEFWVLNFNPYNNEDVSVTDPNNPYTFVMEQASGPNKTEISSPITPGDD